MFCGKKHTDLEKLLSKYMFLFQVKSDEDQDISKISMCELSLAQLLLLPPDSIQVQSLKRELFRYLEDKLEEDEMTKRSFASLVRDGNLPYIPKRSTDELDNDDLKRSIANLAKNGQLPTFQRPEDEQTQTKRGIESLARNGDLHGKRKLENLIEDLYGKRSIASLARGFNYPVAGKRYLGALARTGDLRYSNPNDDYYDKRNIASIVRNGKRNVQSLVRNNNFPGGKRYYMFDELKRNIASLARTMGKYNGKRAVPTAALLRQDGLMKPSEHHHYDEDSKSDDSNNNNHENESTEKRNLGSLKAQLKSKFKRSADEKSLRKKREVDYWDSSEEYPVPVYQNNNVFDYEELMHALTGEYPNEEKRFLGKLVACCKIINIYLLLPKYIKAISGFETLISVITQVTLNQFLKQFLRY